jgi:hypothetical protein
MTSSGPRLFTYTIPVDDGAAPNPFTAPVSSQAKIQQVVVRASMARIDPYLPLMAATQEEADTGVPTPTTL